MHSFSNLFFMKKNLIAIVAVGIALTGAGCAKTVAPTPPATSPNAMMEKTTASENSDAMMKKESTEQKDGETMMKDDTKDGAMMDNKQGAGAYEDYADSKLAWAKEGKVILFFKASWCPTCQAVDTDILAHLGNIPNKTSILKVDYDTSAELKKKYGVTYQHTFVQVDANGTMIKKWSGSPTLTAITAEIK